MTDFIGPDPSMPIIRARVHGEVSDRLQILADGTFLKGDGRGSLSVEGVEAATSPLAPSLASTEDLQMSWTLVHPNDGSCQFTPANSGGGGVVSIGPAMAFPCLVKSVTLSTGSGSGEPVAPLDATNFWQFYVARYAKNNRIGYLVNFKSTKTTDLYSEAISRRSEWNFDAMQAAWDQSAATFNKGDCIGFQIAAAGTPNPLVGLVATIRYERLEA